MTQSHSELIASLGGGTKVASRVSEMSGQGLDREAVYRWSKLNSVPWRWRPYVARMAREMDVTLPDDFLPEMAGPPGSSAEASQ